MAHMKLTHRGPALRPVRDAVDDKRAHAANSLAAIAVKRNRLLAFLDQPFIHDNTNNNLGGFGQTNSSSPMAVDITVPSVGESITEGTLARWLKLPAPQIRLMRDAARLATIWPQLGADNQKPSDTYHLLHDLDPAALQAYTRIKALAKDSVPWSRLHDYLDRLRHIRPAIKGDYLRDQGVPPGPIYKRLLNDLLDSKLDGELPTRDDEERFVREWLASDATDARDATDAKDDPLPPG